MLAVRTTGLLSLLLIWLANRPQQAWAHDGAELTPESLWRAWTLDPTVLLGLVVAGWGYGQGTRRLWQRVGVGRGIAVWRASAFAGGLVVLFIALISPVAALGHALFSAHMLQHMLLTMAAAPLLILGLPAVSLPWALPPSRARRIGRWWHRRSVLQAFWRAATAPLTAWVLSTGTLIVWHVPSWYERALRFELLHALEHLTILGTAFLFWRIVVSAGRSDGIGYGAGILFVFTSAVVGMAFAALITFANYSWYPAYAPVAATWGLTPLDDQALAGIMMWVPGKVVHLVAVLGLLWCWFAQLEHRHATRVPHGHRPVGRRLIGAPGPPAHGSPASNSTLAEPSSSAGCAGHVVIPPIMTARPFRGTMRPVESATRAECPLRRVIPE